MINQNLFVYLTRQTRFFALHQPLTWFACGWSVVIHYFLPVKLYIHARHIYGHLKWASHCLEGDNNSWDSRFVVSGRWCETIILVCLALLWNTHYVPQNGFTPLMGASKSGRTDVVQLLLSSGSKVDLQNKVRSSVNLWLTSSQKWWYVLVHRKCMVVRDL